MKVHSGYLEDIRFEHEHGGGEFHMLPFSTNVVVSQGVYVDRAFRHQGLGDKYHKERLEWAKAQGWITDLLCICMSGNEPQIKILKANGWKMIQPMYQGYGNLWHRSNL